MVVARGAVCEDTPSPKTKDACQTTPVKPTAKAKASAAKAKAKGKAKAEKKKKHEEEGDGETKETKEVEKKSKKHEKKGDGETKETKEVEKKSKKHEKKGDGETKETKEVEKKNKKQPKGKAKVKPSPQLKQKGKKKDKKAKSDWEKEMLAAEEPEPVKEESTAEASSAPKRRKKTKSEVKETKSEVKECDDSQLSLATLLKGQEQMIAQSIWNNAKDMIESQESQSKSELMSALGGSASEVFTEKLAEEFLKFLKIKANPDEVEHDLEKPGDTVMDSSGGLSTEALRALEEQETVPGDITEVAAAPAEPTAPATKAPEVVPPVAPEALALPSVPAAAPETKAPEVAPLAPVAPEALALPSTAPAAAPETKAPEVAPLALPSTAPAAPSTAPAAAVPNLLRTPPHIRLGSTVAHVSLGQQRQMLTAEDLKGMDEANILQKYDEGLIPDDVITSSNCRLYMRMRRYMEDHATEVSCPNMLAMFNGTLKERRSLLRQWLSSGENAERCEVQLKVSRSVDDEMDTEEQLLTIDGMKRAGMSEPKIAAIISSQAPVLDRDHPHIMEEARYWCHIQTKRVCRQRSRLELNATSRVRADGAAINGLLSEARGQAPNGQPMQLQQAMEMLKAQSAPNGDNAGGQPSTKAKPQPKRKTKNPPMPLNPKSWKNIIADGCNDLKKEYLAATCALELPKGNDLRVKLTTLKVEIGQIWDDTKVIDADLIDETTFEKHMAKIADVLTRSKMLRVQARAVAREMASRRIAGAIGQAIRHHLDREIALGFGQGDLTQAFAERRAAKHGLSIKCEISYVEVPVKNDEDEMEIVGWPVLLPRDLMIALINSGYLHMLAGTVEQREAFWERALLDYPQETNNIDPKCKLNQLYTPDDL
ncbi:unnamed protein product [Durusdinium trenchii]|uniref:Uncharacterized protein n=1 Tax=Durusdinium trenchii TaxID=1381693 RepID=A0ABP0KG11_9DINO